MTREAGADPRDLAARAGRRLEAAARLAHAAAATSRARSASSTGPTALLGTEHRRALELLPDLASALFEAGVRRGRAEELADRGRPQRSLGLAGDGARHRSSASGCASPAAPRASTPRGRGRHRGGHAETLREW